MQIKITGKELKVTDAINDYVERKMERIAKYFDDAEADVLIRLEKNAQIAEMLGKSATTISKYINS